MCPARANDGEVAVLRNWSCSFVPKGQLERSPGQVDASQASVDAALGSGFPIHIESQGTALIPRISYINLELVGDNAREFILK